MLPCNTGGHAAYQDSFVSDFPKLCPIPFALLKFILFTLNHIILYYRKPFFSSVSQKFLIFCNNLAIVFPHNRKIYLRNNSDNRLYQVVLLCFHLPTRPP